MNKLLIVFILLPLFCIGQKQGNIWYFGDHAGVDFNSVVPIALVDGATYNTNSYSEGTASIADSLGTLLFYTNGRKLWNKNHSLMLNGDSLFGNFSSTQSSIIIPQPASSEYFYVFTVGDYFEDALKHGLSYSVVDICLDNGFGSVMTNKKNVIVLDTIAEKIAAVQHSNGVDYWVLTHKLYTDEFYAFLLTANGISDTIVTHIGSIHSGAQGQLKFSPDGNKIACGSSYLTYFLELFGFNNSNGIVSNYSPINIPINSRIYGVEFSPDNSKLYANYFSFSPVTQGIVQYDLNAGAGNIDSINNSMNIIHTYGGVSPRGLQLAPDGKIYSVDVINRDYLVAINNPNNYGVLSNIQNNAVYLNGKYGSYCLPTFIANYDYSNTDYNCINALDEKGHVDKQDLIFPNPFSFRVTLWIDKVLKDATLILYNSFGQQVRQVNNVSGQTVTLHRDNLPSGLYYIQLKQGNQTIATHKLIITDY
ncbi:MAG: T9SS type A sorting domain-containing protein [Bacteroidetes bacterium]|nr:T9SS type A sorting domain-containing protein [Bacteroidota bacterium]